jgi:hypothetical protein
VRSPSSLFADPATIPSFDKVPLITNPLATPRIPNLVSVVPLSVSLTYGTSFEDFLAEVKDTSCKAEGLTYLPTYDSSLTLHPLLTSSPSHKPVTTPQISNVSLISLLSTTHQAV